MRDLTQPLRFRTPQRLSAIFSFFMNNIELENSVLYWYHVVYYYCISREA